MTGHRCASKSCLRSKKKRLAAGDCDGGDFHPQPAGLYTLRVSRMDVDSNHLNESALKLALKIMYLLTGEVYVIIKKLGDHATSGSIPHVSEGWNLAQNTLMLPSTIPETLKKNNKNNILELAKKIIALLTKEVPMRSQDVTVYFSMEEWEYLEGHKDLYRDVMMETHKPFTSQGGFSRRKTETYPTHPHCYQEAKKENHSSSSQDHQDGIAKRIKVEVEDPHQISYPHPCKEEVVPTAICPEVSCTRNTSKECPNNPLLLCKAEADTDSIQISPQSYKHQPSSASVYQDLMMYKERSQVIKRIMELTMQIIYLLSRGEYVILKSSGEHVIPSGSIQGVTVQKGIQRTLMLPAPNSLTHELHNEQKILEVTNKIIELLTGEVPLRCQDVTVYFSVEEWEYFEQHKDLYMKRFTSPGYRTSQGFSKRDPAPCRNTSHSTPYGQQNTFQGDTDFSDSEETISDSEDYEDDESQSEGETEDEVPLSKINDPDLQVLLNRLRKIVKESEDYNPQCFQNDPEWGPGF
ncbi:uncharacterized protein LOC130282812 isoform X2 [Hyla sarda]|uniref:uncharacterized protein LOC130282812 isoform X2 n=1 Tax=Hyla sarda TaxID=327740 RepID=UPI0024C2490B|nr:uncharacterized protein LOC130282812 isoform X2 [Hyla sarda]